MLVQFWWPGCWQQESLIIIHFLNGFDCCCCSLCGQASVQLDRRPTERTARRCSAIHQERGVVLRQSPHQESLQCHSIRNRLDWTGCLGKFESIPGGRSITQSSRRPSRKPAEASTMGILCCFQSHAGDGSSQHDHGVVSSSAASSSSTTSSCRNKERPLPERRPGEDRSSNSVDYSNLVALVNEIVADSG